MSEQDDVENFFTTIGVILMMVVMVAVIILFLPDPPQRIEFDGKSCIGWIEKTTRWDNVHCNDGRFYKNVTEYKIIP